jgi:hypothetical protein
MKSKATHARTREDADAGVRDCVELMTSGQWVQGRSHLAIAEKHGVSPTTSRDWATNASRIVRIAIEGDVEDIRAQMLATLGTIVCRCMDAADHRTAVSAMETQAKLLGMLVQKHEIAVTDDEAAKLVAEAAALAK